jgi:hypothetical protein
MSDLVNFLWSDDPLAFALRIGAICFFALVIAKAIWHEVRKTKPRIWFGVPALATLVGGFFALLWLLAWLLRCALLFLVSLAS